MGRRVFVILVFLLCGTTKARAGHCDQARFSGDGVDLYKSAGSEMVKRGTDVTVLCDEESYVFDADGKAVHRVYVTYKVLSQAGAEGWDALSADWRPWHEDKPQIRARVITNDGAVHWLDPKTLVDGPVGEESEKVYSDRRVVRGPLPAMAPGSVVEEETTITQRAPVFASGTVSVAYFGRNVPVQFSRLIVDAPAALPLKYVTHMLAIPEPQRSESSGRVRLVFEQGPSDPIDIQEQYLPSEVAEYPQVVFATGSSWQAVAEGYGKVVDQQLEAKDVEAQVKRLTAGKTSRAEKAAAILAYLSREIRYTGVEFGESAIVPRKPSQTLHEKYGDCKDKAALLIAMLRGAGVPAYMALLNAGRRQEVEADLPGLGLFDHAIVYAPGEPDFWIDATDEYARLGQLPVSDQGRLSLVTSPGSKTLVRIPESSSRDNAIIETREFYLAEYGPARVIETTEAHGVFESEFRSFYADQDGKQSKENLTNYVKEQYLADKVSRMERSDPDDLSKQFRLVVETDKARRGQTDLISSAVGIRLESLFQKLPLELQQRPSEAGNGEQKEGSKKARAEDYQLPEAFVTEWHYRIVPPIGFQPKPLPETRKIALGPAVLTEDFQADKEGIVLATIRFDTVKRRFTIAEATEMRNRVAELRESQPIILYFEPTAQALLSQGKIREASNATRELIAKHPKEAVHHLQRAKALLAEGMGQAARDEAALAVKLEPASALAYKTQAEILRYDLVGREHRRGSDYSGAEAAYRVARRLDAQDKTITENLALLLEYNREGERYGPGAKLKESTAEYLSLSTEELNSFGLKNNPAFTMFYSGEFAEAKKYGESLNPQLNALVVAAEGALNGTQAAMKEARRRVEGEDNFKMTLKTAGEMLMRAGRYASAADLMEAGASGTNAGNTIALASVLRKAKPQREAIDANSPSGLIKKFFLLLGEAKMTRDVMFSLYSRNAQKIMRRSDPDELKKAELTRWQLRGMLSRSGLPADVLLDLTLEMVQVATEGNDDLGYKTTMKAPGNRDLTLYVVKEDGKYKVLDSPEKPNALALEVLDRLAAGNTVGAHALLDWLRDDQHVTGGDDPLAGVAFPRIWSKGKEAKTEEMRLAAAALLAQTKQTAREAAPILEAARGTASSETDKLNISLALLEAYRNLDEYEKCRAIAAELSTRYPDSKRLFWDQQFALKGQQKFGEADSLAEGWLKRSPNDRDAMRALVSSASAREDYRLAHELGKKLVDAGKAEASDLNQVAWSALFAGKITPEDVEFANKAVQISQNAAPELHTQGCIYAEIGKTKEAREVLLQAMDIVGLDEPRGEYAYAFGRIAEQYGETEVALRDYRNVEKPDKAVFIPDSSFRLAQMRLKAMGLNGRD